MSSSKRKSNQVTVVNTGGSVERFDALLAAKAEERIANLRDEIEGLSKAELRSRLLRLEINWGLKTEDGECVATPPNPDKLYDYVFKTFKMPQQDFAIDEVDSMTKMCVTEVCAVQVACDDRDMFDEDVNLKTRLDNLLQLVYYSRQFVYVSHRLKNMFTDSHDSVVNVDRSHAAECCGIAPFFQPQLQASDLSEYQNLILFMLKTAFHRRYRKVEHVVYKQVHNSEAFATNAWKPVTDHADEPMTLEYFIHDECRIMTNFDQWKNMTHGAQNVSRTATYLQNCIDPRFPFLRKNRLVFAFDNGVYVARNISQGRITDMFIPYDSDAPLSKDVIACNFFPYDFRDCADYLDWYDIPTPALQGILTHQEFPDDVCRWMYVFIGRMLYNLNDLDAWQVIPFLKGVAGCGKSTICNLIASIYDPQDVGVLSNNIERKFGLSALYNKFIFVAPEIKNDCKLEQAEFQSIVSGEHVQIAIKNQTAISVVWTTPGFLAGNETPAWTDNSGSFSRRTPVFQFNKSVKDGDNKLIDKLRSEMDLLIQKCNRAYQVTAAECGHLNIWNHLPDYFLQTKKSLQAQTNQLIAFLDESGRVEIKKGACVSMNEFNLVFTQWCREMGMPVLKLTSDFYNVPFSERGITFDLKPCSLNDPSKRGMHFNNLRFTSKHDEPFTTDDISDL